MFFETHLVRDVIEFLFADVLKLLAARFELFVDLDGFLGHLLMRGLGTAEEREVIAFGDALVAVGIKAEAEESGASFLFGVGHFHQARTGTPNGQANGYINREPIAEIFTLWALSAEYK